MMLVWPVMSLAGLAARRNPDNPSLRAAAPRPSILSPACLLTGIRNTLDPEDARDAPERCVRLR